MDLQGTFVHSMYKGDLHVILFFESHCDASMSTVHFNIIVAIVYVSIVVILLYVLFIMSVQYLFDEAGHP